MISIRIAGGPIVHNQFNDIWQVRSRTEGMKHREEENTSSNRPRPSSNRISPSHSLAATFGRQCQDPPICCLSLSLSPSLRHVRDERPPTSPLTSLLWHLLVCMKNHSGRRIAASPQRERETRQLSVHFNFERGVRRRRRRRRLQELIPGAMKEDARAGGRSQ